MQWGRHPHTRLKERYQGPTEDAWEERVGARERAVAERERLVTESELHLEAYRCEAVGAEERRVRRLEDAERQLEEREARLSGRDSEMQLLLQEKADHIARLTEQLKRTEGLLEGKRPTSTEAKAFTVQYGDAAQMFCLGDADSFASLKTSIKDFFAIPQYSNIALLTRVGSEGSTVCITGCDALERDTLYHIRVTAGSALKRSPCPPPPRQEHHAVTALVVGVDAPENRGNASAAAAVAASFVQGISDVELLTHTWGVAPAALPSLAAVVGGIRKVGRAWGTAGSRGVFWFCGQGSATADGFEALHTHEGNGDVELLLDDDIFKGLALRKEPGMGDMPTVPLVLIFDAGRATMDMQYMLKCGADSSIVAQEIDGLPPMKPNVFVLSVQYLFTTPRHVRDSYGGLMTSALLKVLSELDAPTCVEVLTLLRLEMQEELPPDVVPLPWLGCSSRLNLAQCPFPLTQADWKARLF